MISDDDKIENIARGIVKYLEKSLTKKEQLLVLEKIGKIINLPVTKASVTTAVELSYDEKKRLVEVIHQKFGEGLTINFSVDSEILGGIRIKIGDTLIDHSFKKILKTLEEKVS